MSENDNNHSDFKTATILFVDLVGSSGAASFMTSSGYNDHLSTFKTLINDTCDQLFDRESGETDVYQKQVQGDQGFFLFASSWTTDDKERKAAIEKDIIEILRLALQIKYRWQLEPINIKLIEANKKPFEIAIGINTGTVGIKRKNGNGHNYVTEGYAINLAKRIEGESRKGSYSKIFVGESTYGLYLDRPGENPIRFKRQELSPLKGIAGNIRIYEIAFASIEDEEEEENAILVIPDEWKKESSGLRDALEITKKYFLATQDPWLANAYCNVLWAQIKKHIEKSTGNSESDKLDLNKSFLGIIDTARKLVEFDSGFSAWKVYLGQMVLDYFKYSLKREEKVEENVFLLKDTIDILIDIISSEPYELDARLTLGRIYLEAIDLPDQVREEVIGPNKSAKELAIEQFKRILVWEDKYEEAHYYCAAALAAKERDGSTKEESLEEARHHLDYLLELFKKRSASKEEKEKMLRDALEDPLFKTLKSEIETLLKGIN